MNRDKIVISGLTFYGYHGVHPEEKVLGQRFTVDVEIGLDLTKAGISDNLNDTANYSEVQRIVGTIVEGPARNLIEAVAEHIAQSLLAETPAEWVLVRLSKPSAPMKGNATGSVAVEVRRERPS